MTTFRKVLLGILGVTALSFAVVRGPGIVKAKALESKEYGAALKALKANSLAVETAGYVMAPSTPNTGEEVSVYDRAIESQPDINAAVSSRDGTVIMQTIATKPEAYQEVLSAIPKEGLIPLVERDILEIARSRTTSIFLDGLDQYARQKLLDGDLSEARKAMEISSEFLQHIKSDNEQMSLAVQFGSCVDLLERYHAVLIHPKASKADVEWVKNQVTDFQHPITLSDYVANQVFERIQAMENREAYDDDEWQNVNIEGYNEFLIEITPVF
ncbi:MAG: hypothetical protein KDC26_09140, partial [Armatimonadetes bacterium]|nr:hypothetical protein [Armatimonadota bacterium]